MPRGFRTVLSAALLVGAVAGSARATTFSFASDFNSNGFTFAGTAGAGGSFTIGQANTPNSFQLIVDDNNGPLPSITIPVEFHASFTATGHVSTPLGGSLFLHSYLVSGTFGFYQGGNALLTCTFGAPGSGVFQVPGGASSWSSSGGVLGADSFADVTYNATALLVSAMASQGANAAAYGIVAGVPSIGPDDFSFDWTQLHGSSVGSTVLLDANGLPTTVFASESSFSGSAVGGLPAPGTAGLLVGIALVGARRRRA